MIIARTVGTFDKNRFFLKITCVFILLSGQRRGSYVIRFLYGFVVTDQNGFSYGLVTMFLK